VFGANGQVFFSSGPEGHRSSVPASWQKLLAQGSGGEAWSIRDSSALVTGVELTNSFEQTVGGLAVSYSRQSFDAASRSMLIDIIVGCGKILAIALIVAVAAVLVVVRPIGRSFQRTISSLSRFRDEGASTLEAAPPAAGGLDLAVERFKERMVAGQTRIGLADKQLDNLKI
jgi:hypothetical protein